MRDRLPDCRLTIRRTHFGLSGDRHHEFSKWNSSKVIVAIFGSFCSTLLLALTLTLGLGEALGKIQKVCSKEFVDLIERGHVPGLKSPEHLLAFAKLGETEMAELRTPLYRSRLSLAQSRKFLLEKTNNGELDWDWTARQFLSLMNGQDKQVCTRVLLTPRGKFAWTMELRKIERQNNDENEEQS